MLIHIVTTYLGSARTAQGEAHQYGAQCGATFYSLHAFQPGQQIQLGAPPHAHCAKCFPEGPVQPPVKVMQEQVVDIDGATQDTDGTLGKEHDPSGLGPLQGGDFP